MDLHLGNWIAGLDFNPSGERVATIDCYGVCLLSDVDTNNYGFHLGIGSRGGNSDIPKYSSSSNNYYHFYLITDLMVNEYSSCPYASLLDWLDRCRWSTNSGEPLIFVKYDRDRLNILDVEKKALTLKNPVQLEKDECKYFASCFSSFSLPA